MLQPKRTKFRKVHRGRLKGQARRESGVRRAKGSFRFWDRGKNFGLGLQPLEPCWLTAQQIEAGRRVLSRTTKRGGQILIRIFPDKSVTYRPPETRMGSGKGAPEKWVAVIKPGQVLYEIKAFSNFELTKKALKNAGYKLPIKTQIIYAYDSTSKLSSSSG
uniref:50S ribosomal protein L16, chloroplastic n=1 Tax=Caulerpa cliftonii TaxID=1004391 RepID=A0A1C9JBM9_9CHLO|nr:ribosomal protein L16 [Caulerpa cliftonii]AOP19247.1 ribosomal protein L16 [Caulerpa cliftonii]